MATVNSASQFVFLHELRKFKVNTKVRFICCVLEYDNTTGLVLVEHAYPATAPQTPRAHVDINLVIETTKSELFECGTWINVIGYTQPSRRPRAALSRTKTPPPPPPPPPPPAGATSKEKQVIVNNNSYCRLHPHIQAILVWDAGPLIISDYEASLEKHRASLSKARNSLNQFQSGDF